MKREPGKVHRPERIGAMRLSHGFQKQAFLQILSQTSLPTAALIGIRACTHAVSASVTH
jgi:hypothetical protein